jgi:hypothetical protein
MHLRHRAFPALLVGTIVLGACAEAADPTGPAMIGPGVNAAVVPNEHQLAAWFEHASPAALELAGVVYADHDEDNKRLVFGVEHPGAGRGIEMRLARLGIPSSAVSIVEAEPIYQLATLRDVFRPTKAGIQLHFGQFVCSLGFNADDGTQRSLVTASHCTNKQGGVEGTRYFQPLSSVDGTVIATEVEDPDYFRNRNGCPKGKRCRFSDAARALYNSSVASLRGEIAATTGVNNGSLTVTGSSLNVTSQNNTSTTWANGTAIDKIGRTTGWTRGNVTASCVNTGVSGTNIVQLCQTFVTGSGTIVQGGDSGSGTFRVTSGSNVELVGILWGGNGSGTQFVYSPLKQVRDELGPLNGVK